ncbi:hypothetical protein CERZMDRAFT_84344 [Cercospora zeae-maydis SCOH1-5]|uniref:Uncharacterized protein n=1 Tax=Cercospora zeae-maydis SCOH1-5 TaxID=717836 RepID=A0A6A6FHI1_9PEZI|nr:hypothetical protein CERZMDRAFT_84344 [Cercospora zeae-maydis SCOH1-5]
MWPRTTNAPRPFPSSSPQLSTFAEPFNHRIMMQNLHMLRPSFPLSSPPLKQTPSLTASTEPSKLDKMATEANITNNNTTNLACTPTLHSRPKRERKPNQRYISSESQTTSLSPNTSSFHPTNTNSSGKTKLNPKSSITRTTTSRSKNQTEPPNPPPIPSPVVENAIPGTNPPRAPTCAWTLPTAVSGIDPEIVFAAASLMLLREEGQEVLDAARAMEDQLWVEGEEGQEGEEEKRERYTTFLQRDDKRRAAERLAKYWM